MEQSGTHHCLCIRACISSTLSPREWTILDKSGHCTQGSTIILSFKEGHSENLSFFEYISDLHPLILGLPWRRQHNTQINWSTGEIISWTEHCFESCFPLAGKIINKSVTVALLSPVSELPDSSCVPECYQDLREVVSKAQATCLPLHHPYDSRIHPFFFAAWTRLPFSPAGAGYTFL